MKKLARIRNADPRSPSSLETELRTLMEKGMLWKADQPHDHLIEQRAQMLSGNASTTPRVAQFGISEIDNAFPDGGLPFGQLHEFALDGKEADVRWAPPLFLTCALIGTTTKQNSSLNGRLIAWVGKDCWPTSHTLQQCLGENGISSSLFLNPQDREETIWSAIQLARSPAVGVVVVDGNKLNLRDRRRLQLSVKHHAPDQRPFCVLLSHPSKLREPCPAFSRWLFLPHSSTSKSYCWDLSLVRCRGTTSKRNWIVEWCPDEQNSLALLSHVEPAQTLRRKPSRSA